MSAEDLPTDFSRINYLMRPEAMAGISNYVWYANAIPSSEKMIEQEILEHPGIYPTDDAKKGLYTFVVTPPNFDRAYTRVWTAVKTNN